MRSMEARQLLRTRSTVITTAVSLMLGGCSSNNQEEVAAPRTIEVEGLTDPNRDSSDTASTFECKYTNENPQPLVSQDPPIIEVYGLCDREAPEAAVGIYEVPSQEDESGDPLKSLIQANTGDRLEIACVDTKGQSRSDSSGRPTSTWVNVKLKGQNGFIPEPWVGYVNDEKFNICP